MKNGKEFLLTDTVGFIQRLPTTLVAAFRATLEKIWESSLLVHVIDISHPFVEQQIDAVEEVHSELDASSIPNLIVWNKVDKAGNPKEIKLKSKSMEDTICISALNGSGFDQFCNADSMVCVESLVTLYCPVHGLKDQIMVDVKGEEIEGKGNVHLPAIILAVMLRPMLIFLDWWGPRNLRC